MAKYCPKCKHTNFNDALFCASCDAPFESFKMGDSMPELTASRRLSRSHAAVPHSPRWPIYLGIALAVVVAITGAAIALLQTQSE